MAKISIVLPAYNEEANIPNTTKVLAGLMEEQNIDYELVYVSDGSKDGTYREIQKASQENKHVIGAEFSRNFGKEAAIFAGLELSTGDAVVVMDCDLQHPPSAIPEMIEKWKAGAQVVEGIKTSRGKESLAHKASAGLFYKIMSKIINMDMQASSDYKLLDRQVVQVLLEMPERNTFFRAMSFWVGFRTDRVFYEVQERQFGASKWSTFSLIKYAIRNATSFSTMPLQLITVMGVIAIIGSIALAIQTMIRFLMGNSVEGFTTVILLILIIGGLIMLSLGIIGNYIARIYEEVKGRPRYIIGRVTENVPEEMKGGWYKRTGK